MGEAMRTKTTKTRAAFKRRVLLALTAGFAVCAVPEQAQAQEVMITGPLAGAPAVRKLRLYREGRFELGGTLLDATLQALIELGDLVLRPPALGDVHHGPDHARRLALLVAQHPRPVRDHRVAPVGAPEAVLLGPRIPPVAQDGLRAR